METSQNHPRPRGIGTRHALGRVAAILGVASLACVITVGLIERPRYALAALSPPTADLPHGGWSMIQRSTLALPGEYHRFFLVRFELDLFAGSGQSSDSWASITAYFERAISGEGFERYEAAGFRPCAAILPEARFLPSGPNGYVAFRRHGSVAYAAEPTVCLAVWPIEGDDEGFYVVLVTANPSPITRWSSCLELGCR